MHHLNADSGIGDACILKVLNVKDKDLSRLEPEASFFVFNPFLNSEAYAGALDYLLCDSEDNNRSTEDFDCFLFASFLFILFHLPLITLFDTFGGTTSK